ncbi:RNA polymerase sigma factor [Micromonospora sp. LH3U1]|uniref:RNA polymerase sigma factor n=1 Tax=Micromonospora sp. LH3U1 TaxID=3018339 RepID=UPI003FA591CA
MTVSDGDLISRLYAGCFRRLVVQLYAVTGDLNEAQEAVQEAFTKALAAPRRLAELENPEAWLRRVAVNEARSRYRRRRVLDRLLRRIGPPPTARRAARAARGAATSPCPALPRRPAGGRAVDHLSRRVGVGRPSGLEWVGISHGQVNAAGQPARLEYARAFGIPLTTFAEWA